MWKQQVQGFIETGNLDGAKRLVAEFEETIDGVECVEVLTIKAAIAVAENNLQEAEAYLQEGLLIDSEYIDLLFNLGYIYKLRNNLIQSNYYFKKALSVAKDVDIINIIDQFMNENRQQRLLTEHPLVSIVLLAYNKLSYTKLCVESILKYTENINYELILVNNGSTDETKEYFDSLPFAKPLHLINNVGPTNGFNEGMRVAVGKYTACVCNDFIFTPRWLENLLICIESDKRIGFVSPGASTMSNLQQINGDYNNIEEMIQFAERYNHSDPRKWEERVRLLPCVLLARTELLKDIDYYDPRFYYGEFADDDISFRIRRAGYKLVYCRDTFTYHFGSVTVREDQTNNNSLGISRDIFRAKYDLDSWIDTAFNARLLNEISVKLSSTHASILGINTKCGSNPLQLKNMLKDKGVRSTHITNYCIDKKYTKDIRTVSDDFFEGEIDYLHKKLIGMKFDYIVFEYESEHLNRSPQIIGELSSLLNQSGQLALSLSYPEFDEVVMNKDVVILQNSGLAISYYEVTAKNNSSEVELEIILRKDV
ncbi:glycosyltransferase [Paenibacillus sp. FSL R7-0163]|uniref:glycosyltransferase n=1 Tax=Paenibacillus sp. FSL R7-0163 TaxID=2954530 RepID=UPI0030D830A6